MELVCEGVKTHTGVCLVLSPSSSRCSLLTAHIPLPPLARRHTFNSANSVGSQHTNCVALDKLLNSVSFSSSSVEWVYSYIIQGCPTFWHLWATLEEEELSSATH